MILLVIFNQTRWEIYKNIIEDSNGIVNKTVKSSQKRNRYTVFVQQKKLREHKLKEAKIQHNYFQFEYIFLYIHIYIYLLRDHKNQLQIVNGKRTENMLQKLQNAHSWFFIIFCFIHLKYAHKKRAMLYIFHVHKVNFPQLSWSHSLKDKAFAEQEKWKKKYLYLKGNGKAMVKLFKIMYNFLKN